MIACDCRGKCVEKLPPGRFCREKANARAETGIRGNQTMIRKILSFTPSGNVKSNKDKKR